MAYDAMHAVSGPSVRRVFMDDLGLPPSRLAILHPDPKPDFGGLHADPNLVRSAVAHLTAAKVDATNYVPCPRPASGR